MNCDRSYPIVEFFIIEINDDDNNINNEHSNRFWADILVDPDYWEPLETKDTNGPISIKIQKNSV